MNTDAPQPDTPADLRNRSLWKHVAAAIFIMAVGFGIPAYHMGNRILGTRTVAPVMSVSPCGQFRCRVDAGYSVISAYARVSIEAKDAAEGWRVMKADSFYMERPLPADYSFQWMLDDAGLTRSVTVYARPNPVTMQELDTWQVR